MGYLRAYRDEAADVPNGVMSFLASTAGVKRDDLEIDQSKWALDNYRNNPVVLWAHDYSSLPIGRAEVEPGKDALRATVTFDMADEFAARVYGKYQNGMLNAVSVGWRDLDEDGNAVNSYRDAAKVATHELLDISAVPVPGDPDALAERTREALRSMLRDLDDEDDNDDDWPSWREAAAEMVDVFASWGEMPEAERRRLYKRLVPIYRHHDRTPPEWHDDETLACYDEDTWRAIFLEGELDAMDPVTRAGAVLNARNKADLAEAQRLIQRVLDSAKGGADDDAKEDNDDGERVDVDALTRLIQELENDDFRDDEGY